MKILKNLALIALLIVSLMCVYLFTYKKKGMPPQAASRPATQITSNPKTKLELDIEKSLLIRFKRIWEWYDQELHERDDTLRNGVDTLTTDSMMASMHPFNKLLFYYASHYPETIHFQFDSLRKYGLEIVTAPDGKFRIYTYTEPGPGTMHFYKSLFQYKSDKGLIYVYVEPKDEDDGLRTGSYYNGIYSLDVAGKPYYLVRSYNAYWGTLSYQSIDVYSIEDTLLNNHVKLIKTKSDITSELGFEYNPFTDKGDDLLIKYDPITKTISFPVVYKDRTITNKTIQYQFNGQYFEKKQ